MDGSKGFFKLKMSVVVHHHHKKEISDEENLMQIATEPNNGQYDYDDGHHDVTHGLYTYLLFIIAILDYICNLAWNCASGKSKSYGA